MILILPIKSLVFFGVMGMSTYTLITFLLTATPLEIQFMGVILNLLSVGLSMYLIFNGIPHILEAIENKTPSDVDVNVDVDSVQIDRQVEEKDGTLIVTTTYTLLDKNDEVREILENAAPTDTPTEETTEFADLLDSEKKAN